MKQERLDVLCSLAAGVAVADMADGHLTLKLSHLHLIEDLCHKTFASCSMKVSRGVNSHDTATLLSTMLKGVQAIVSQACCILNTIDSKHTTLMVQLVIPIIVFTLTHCCSFFISSPIKSGMTVGLLSAEVCYSIIKERLLKSLVHDVLEQVALITLSMSHLTENLTILADDTLDSVV